PCAVSYCLSLHDALPICGEVVVDMEGVRGIRRKTFDGQPERNDIILVVQRVAAVQVTVLPAARARFVGTLVEIHARCGQCRRSSDRKSTRLNSSHRTISY